MRRVPIIKRQTSKVYYPLVTVCVCLAERDEPRCWLESFGTKNPWNALKNQARFVANTGLKCMENCFSNENVNCNDKQACCSVSTYIVYQTMKMRSFVSKQTHITHWRRLLREIFTQMVMIKTNFLSKPAMRVILTLLFVWSRWDELRESSNEHRTLVWHESHRPIISSRIDSKIEAEKPEDAKSNNGVRFFLNVNNKDDCPTTYVYALATMARHRFKQHFCDVNVRWLFLPLFTRRVLCAQKAPEGTTWISRTKIDAKLIVEKC